MRVEVEDLGEVFGFAEEALHAGVDLEDGGRDEDFVVAHELVDEFADGVRGFVAEGDGHASCCRSVRDVRLAAYFTGLIKIVEDSICTLSCIVEIGLGGRFGLTKYNEIGELVDAVYELKHCHLVRNGIGGGNLGDIASQIRQSLNRVRVCRGRFPRSGGG